MGPKEIIGFAGCGQEVSWASGMGVSWASGVGHWALTKRDPKPEGEGFHAPS